MKDVDVIITIFLFLLWSYRVPRMFIRQGEWSIVLLKQLTLAGILLVCICYIDPIYVWMEMWTGITGVSWYLSYILFLWALTIHMIGHDQLHEGKRLDYKVVVVLSAVVTGVMTLLFNKSLTAPVEPTFIMTAGATLPSNLYQLLFLLTLYGTIIVFFVLLAERYRFWKINDQQQAVGQLDYEIWVYWQNQTCIVYILLRALASIASYVGYERIGQGSYAAGRVVLLLLLVQIGVLLLPRSVLLRFAQFYRQIKVVQIVWRLRWLVNYLHQLILQCGIELPAHLFRSPDDIYKIDAIVRYPEFYLYRAVANIIDYKTIIKTQNIVDQIAISIEAIDDDQEFEILALNYFRIPMRERGGIV